jgi:hypothetical protein
MGFAYHLDNTGFDRLGDRGVGWEYFPSLSIPQGAGFGCTQELETQR